MTINKYLEHTLLKPEATVSDIIHLCQEAQQWQLRAVCVNPCYAGLARHLLGESSPENIQVVTVIGFPLGEERTETKVLATRLAMDEDHVDEIDMVMNMAAFKSGNHAAVVEDIAAVVKAAAPFKVKVIIEACLLTNQEKETACKLVAKAGAAFVKTSTGFNKGGATVEDVALLSSIAKNYGLEVKAAGGIRDLATAEKMLAAGATRIGTSAAVAICSEEQAQ